MFDIIKQFFAGLEESTPLRGPALQSSSEFFELEQKIGYTFKDSSLLTLALTHKSSIKSENDPLGLHSNERLEFLGDAVLDFLVTEELFNRYPQFAEGNLSKMKSLIVSRKILGIIADRIKLESFVIKGRSEKKNSKSRKSSIGSNAFEALLGAVYIDSNSDTVRILLQKLLFPSIELFLNDDENGNYKSKILELSQSKGFGIPQYPLVAEVGPDHLKKFTVAIEVGGERMGEGTGKNKKEAQQEAARLAVKIFEEKYPADDDAKTN